MVTPPAAPRCSDDILRLLNREVEVMGPARQLAQAIHQLPTQFQQPPKLLVYGGYLRDGLLGRRARDADMQVYGVRPDTLESLLHQTFPGLVKRAGRQYEVLKVSLPRGVTLDISIPRRDREGVSPHEAGDPTMSPHDAAALRDFTVNSVAADPLSGELFDPYGGLSDLRSRALRVVDPDDFQGRAVQIFRAFQLHARFGFEPDRPCRQALEEGVRSGRTASIAPNAITEELKKLLVKGDKPSAGLRLMHEVGVFRYHFLPLRAPAVIDLAWHRWTERLDRAARITRRDGLYLFDRLVVVFATFWSRAWELREGLGDDGLIFSYFRELSVAPTLPTAVARCLNPLHPESSDAPAAVPPPAPPQSEVSRSRGRGAVPRRHREPESAPPPPVSPLATATTPAGPATPRALRAFAEVMRRPPSTPHRTHRSSVCVISRTRPR